MAKQRASIFDAGDQLDVSSFVPKPKPDASAPAVEQVRAVSQTANFRSREPSPPKPEQKSKRAPRLHRTGRNVQFNVKAKQETVDAIYAITEAHPGWVLGYTLERAVEALQRELKKQS
jgi:hypothetical protein